MFDTFLVTFEKMLQLMGFIAVGYGIKKLRILPKSAEQGISKLATTVLLSCLFLYTNIVECKLEYLGQYAVLVLIGGAFCLAGVALAYPVSKWFGGENNYLRGIYRNALAIPNTSSVAMPLVLALFGTEGLFRYNMFQFVLLLVSCSWGILQLQPGRSRQTLAQGLKRLITPQFLALVVGMMIGAAGGKNWVPAPVLNVIKDLNNCFVPISLLIVGFTLGNYPLGKVLGNKKAYFFTLWRCILMPCVCLGVLLVSKASLAVATWVAMTYASPGGVNVIIFPSSYGEDCAPSAGLVLVSTLISAFSIPLIYALVQMFFA